MVSRWDIYQTWLQFEDIDGGKRRPVLIINVAEDIYLVMKITSSDKNRLFNYQIKEWEKAGLDKPSIVRLNQKIRVPKDTEMVRKGSLLKIDIDAIKYLCNYYGISLTESIFESLIQSSSNKALQQNIKTEINSGKSPKQAAAIAYNIQRKNESMKDTLGQDLNNLLFKDILFKDMWGNEKEGQVISIGVDEYDGYIQVNVNTGYPENMISKGNIIQILTEAAQRIESYKSFNTEDEKEVLNSVKYVLDYLENEFPLTGDVLYKYEDEPIGKDINNIFYFYSRERRPGERVAGIAEIGESGRVLAEVDFKLPNKRNSPKSKSEYDKISEDIKASLISKLKTIYNKVAKLNESLDKTYQITVKYHNEPNAKIEARSAKDRKDLEYQLNTDDEVEWYDFDEKQFISESFEEIVENKLENSYNINERVESSSSFVELEGFKRDWEDLGLNDDDLRDLQNLIINNPSSSIPLGSNVYKIRFSPKRLTRGKDTANRVIYIEVIKSNVIYLATAFSKSEEVNISKIEEDNLRTFAKILNK